MADVQKHFITFHNAIKLSKVDEAYKNTRQKDNNITDAIKTQFKDSGYPVIEDFIQGSFSTDTAILHKAGDFDIDRAIVIDFDQAPEDPVKPKINIADEVLVKKGFKNALIKKPCVTADYSGQLIHIDIPVYKKQGDSYYLAVGKRNASENNKKWDDADPKGLKNWIRDTSGYTGSAGDKQQQFIRIVRYLKRWRNFKFEASVAKGVYSIGITVMVKECFSPVFDEDGRPDDLQALKQVTENMLNRGYFVPIQESQYRVTVNLPVKPWRDIFDSSGLNVGTQFKNKLQRLNNKINDAIDEKDEIKCCEILRDMFGEDFPVPDKPSGNSNNGGNKSKSTFASAGIVGTSQGA